MIKAQNAAQQIRRVPDAPKFRLSTEQTKATGLEDFFPFFIGGLLRVALAHFPREN